MRERSISNELSHAVQRKTARHRSAFVRRCSSGLAKSLTSTMIRGIQS